MRQFLFTVVSAAALSACSEGRERRVLSIDSTLEQPDLVLPDTASRRDTSVPVASRNEPLVPRVERHASTPKSPRAKPAKPVRRPRRAPVPETSPDTSVQAYAPSPPADSARTAPDTTPSLSRDTATVLQDSTQVAGTTPVRDDTATTSPVEMATTQPADSANNRIAGTATIRPADTATTKPADTATAGPDSLTSRPADTTARAPDTTSTLSASTRVASTPEAAAVQPDRSAADLAARTLPVGTEIHAQLDDSITSRRDTVGQIVSAHVMENVRGPNGRTLIPAGAQVRFSIARLRPSRSKGSQGRLALRADSIALDGQLATVQAETRAVPRELRGRGVTGGDAAKVGGGAAAGAVIGGVVGGDAKGAVIGGVAGAAAGAVVATQTATRDVVVKAKTPVVFVLTAPLVAP